MGELVFREFSKSFDRMTRHDQKRLLEAVKKLTDMNPYKEGGRCALPREVKEAAWPYISSWVLGPLEDVIYRKSW